VIGIFEDTASYSYDEHDMKSLPVELILRRFVNEETHKAF